MIPALARSIYFGALAIRREGVIRQCKELGLRERWPLEELVRQRRRGLIALLQHALETVPQYQKTYEPFRGELQKLTENDDVEALVNQLPVLEKGAVQEAPTRYRSTVIPDRETLLDRTSGSTGTPLIFPVDRRAWGLRHARDLQWMSWFGIRPGERYVTFWGLHWNRRSRLQVALRDIFLNRVRVSAYQQDEAFLETALKRVWAFKPSWLFGYPSALADFCAYAKGKGQNLQSLSLKAVLTTAEPLRDHQRSLISEVCGCPVATGYGGAEQGSVAFECPENGIHQMVDTIFIEPRKKDQPSEVPVEILTTDLSLRAVPLIRYAIGDEVAWRAGPCSCGRTYPLLDRIEGRAGFPITLPNGRAVNANLPSYIFKNMAEKGMIRRYRFVDAGDGGLHLYLVVAPTFGTIENEKVRKETSLAFGEDIALTIHRVEQIPPLPNAKHRDYVVTGAVDNK